MFSRSRLLQLTEAMKGKLVVVYGDIVADRFIYGTPKRISREAPVLILKQYREDVLLGGAGNAINNIFALGGLPLPVSVLGNDAAADALTAQLAAHGIDCGGILRTDRYATRIPEVALTLQQSLDAEAVLITRGSRGMALLERDATETLQIPVYGTDQVADVTGAGDTVIATFTLALAAGASYAEAAKLANYGGGIVVMKMGTATVSNEELAHAIERDEDLAE